MGATGGFILGALLAHSRLLQRGLLPYVVASQTVPILAIAPMVVIWLASVNVTARSASSRSSGSYACRRHCRSSSRRSGWRACSR
jgi:hypothetical protein